MAVLDVNNPICIFMNFYENLKNDRTIIGERKQEATTRNLDPVIEDLPYTPLTISTGLSTIMLSADHSVYTLIIRKTSTPDLFNICLKRM